MFSGTGRDGVLGGVWTASWTREDVLVVGGYLVEIDSYAIALLAMQVVGVVTRWGLFLMRGVHPFFPGSVAYGKAGTAAEYQNSHSRSAVMARSALSLGMHFQKLCQKSRTRAYSSDDYQIESSTDVCP